MNGHLTRFHAFRPQASCTLDAGVKIYAARVDSVYTETFKVRVSRSRERVNRRHSTVVVGAQPSLQLNASRHSPQVMGGLNRSSAQPQQEDEPGAWNGTINAFPCVASPCLSAASPEKASRVHAIRQKSLKASQLNRPLLFASRSQQRTARRLMGRTGLTARSARPRRAAAPRRRRPRCEPSLARTHTGDSERRPFPCRHRGRGT